MNKFIKQHCINKTGLIAGIFLFILPAIACAARPLEKIFIDADHMLMNIKSGTSVYSGNVKISQGKLVLMGDKVTLERADEVVKRITVTGRPARYKHITEAGETINAQSEHMVYTASQNMLILTVNARLQQPDLKLSSQKITYDTQKNIVIAGSSNDAKQAERVNITLTPKESPAGQ